MSQVDRPAAPPDRPTGPHPHDDACACPLQERATPMDTNADDEIADDEDEITQPVDREGEPEPPPPPAHDR